MIKYIILGIIFSHNFARSQEIDSTAQNVEAENIIKRLDLLSSRGCLFVGYGANPTPEEIDNLNTLNSLSLLSPEKLKVLLNSANPYTKVYAFNTICIHYPKSLVDEDLRILNDTNKLFFCMGETAVDAGITVGLMATESYSQIELRNDLDLKRIQIEKIINEFIVEYAQFPESYKSIEFTDYIIHSVVDSKTLDDRKETESYEIKHVYQIKNKAGEIQEFSHYFILTHDLSINIIEFSRSKKIWVNPPELSNWFDLIGRKLSKKDLKKLQLA